MPRKARNLVPDVPYHITQRGNRKQDVFFTIKDRRQYLKWLGIYSSKYRFEILAYCLMPNHIHIIGIPHTPTSISRTLQIVQMMHSQSINKSKGWDGHLWHSRYYSSALDDPHLWLALRYVEQNPVRSGIVDEAWNYRWSSAAFHCGLRKDPIVSQNDKLFGAFDDWADVLEDIPDKEALDIIRQRTFKSIPCGDEVFVNAMSRRTGLSYKKPTMGRPCNK
jgi:putative transposase